MSRNNTRHILKVSATKKQNLLERGFYSSPVIQENYLAVSAFSFSILPIVLILNALFVVVVLRTKKLQTNPNKLLILLALVDIFNALIPHTLFAAETLLFGNGVFYQNLDNYVSNIAYCFGGISFLTVGLVSFERYFAIVYPFLYEEIYCLKCTLLIYVVSISMFLCSILLMQDGFYIYTTLLLLLGCLFTCFCYYNIYIVSKKTVQRCSTVSVGSINTLKANAKNNKAALVGALIMITLIISYTPFIIYSIFLMLAELKDEFILYKLLIFRPWAQICALMNGIYSPLIYYWRIKSVRNRLLKYLFRERIINKI